MNQLLILFITLFSIQLYAIEEFVTYNFSGGRFGDNLLAYLHAKWFSFEHQIPLLYRPFCYSSGLKLDDEEIPYASSFSFRYRTSIEKWPFAPSFLPSIIYVCPYFPYNLREDFSIEDAHKPTPYTVSFPIDWENPEFRRSVQNLIQPKSPLELTTPPRELISIAIHIREGGGYDDDYTRRWAPFKLPPLEFYIEGLQTILDLLPGKTPYCYLFTDAQSPEVLAQKIRDALPGYSFTIDYRQTSNGPTSNVLEDFFSLFEFDILIHPLSNYSLVPALIHDYAITFRPVSVSRIPGKPIRIVETKLTVNDPLYQKLIEK